MIIPIGHEEESCRRLPVITFGIMALCLLGFVLSGELGDTSARDFEASEKAEEVLEYYLEHPYLRFGLVPSDPSPIGFLTHMFLHAGFLHLIGNMLMLYLAGPFIEDVWGRPLYAAFYVVAGIAAALAFVATNSDVSVPMIGASGAIAGVMGAFLVRYTNTQIHFFYWIGLFFRGTFSAPAWVMLPLWFAEQLFMAAMLEDVSGGGVAYWAHIGGFVFGVGAAIGIRHWGIEQKLDW
jgi:membrane associated rhomboid family serine protease